MKARNLALYLLNEKGYFGCSDLAQYMRNLLVDEIDQILNPICHIQFHSSDNSRIWILKYWNESDNFDFLLLFYFYFYFIFIYFILFYFFIYLFNRLINFIYLFIYLFTYLIIYLF